MDLDRIPLGVKILDEDLQGGIPRSSFVLITGNSGAGKTVLTLQVVKRNYEKMPILYVSTEMTLKGLREQYESLYGKGEGIVMTYVGVSKKGEIYLSGEDKIEPDLALIDFYTLRSYARILMEQSGEEKKKYVNPLNHYLVINLLKQVIRNFFENKNLLLIIDSASMLYAHAPSMARRIGLELMWNLKRDNLTALITAQYSPTTDTTYGYGIEHVVDGVIELYREDPIKAKGKAKRYLAVTKMRATPISLKRYVYEIRKGVGIEIVSEE